MRLNCSKNNRISVQRHLTWFNGLAMQNPADVIRKYPQIAVFLQNGYGLSCTGKISRSMWQQVLMNFFSLTLAGAHKELLKLFPVCAEFSSAQYFIGAHRIHSVLGSGSDACVYKTDDGFCLKVVGISKKEKLKKEYEILKYLQHPGIVRCYDFICNADCAAILMEELTPLLDEEKSYMQALEYCHSKKILHGDIRLNNLGIDADGNGKLFDFGNASVIQSADDRQTEIKRLKTVMQSPIAAARQTICRGDVLC